MRTTEIVGDKVSVVGLGCWQFGAREWGWGKDFGEKEAHAIVQRALDLGITFFDTAEVYGRGQSERILSRALGDRRPEVFLATKMLPLFPTGPMVRKAVRGSLYRLRTAHIDLYQLHGPNPVVPLRLTMEGMRGLVGDGLVRHVGVSNYSRARWEAAEAALGGPVATNQVQYSLVRRSPDADLIPWARRQARVVIAYSPLGQGVLSGRYRADNAPGGVRAANSLFTPVNLERLQPLIDALREVASAHDATPAQVALAWTIHGPGVVTIPGARSVAQVEANAAAADISLAEDEYQHLTSVATSFHRDRVGALAHMARRLLRIR